MKVREANVNRELELIRLESTTRAAMIGYILTAYEGLYATMETLAGSFFDNEKRRQITLGKIVKAVIKDQLATFIDAMAQEFKFLAQRNAIKAAEMAITHQWGAMVGYLGVSAKYGAAAGVLHGVASAMQSSAQRELTAATTAATTGTGTTKSSSGTVSGGTSAGAITEAPRMMVTISPSISIQAQTVLMGGMGTIQEAGDILGMIAANAIQQSLETGAIDLSLARRR